ncbi:Nuclease, EndA/NucM family (fragment) [Capnocytophaga cynodegmi]
MIMGVKGIIFTIISFFSIYNGILSSLKQKDDEKIRKSKIPFEVREYYKGIDFSKKGAELYEDLAILTIEKHTKFLKYSDRHHYLYKADCSEVNPENVTLIYTSEERFWKEYEGNKKYSPNTFNTEHVCPR